MHALPPLARKMDPFSRSANTREIVLTVRWQVGRTVLGKSSLVTARRGRLTLPRYFEAGARGPHPLPAPRRADHWQRARLVTVAETNADGQWQELPPIAPQVTAQKGPELVPPIWAGFEPGAAVEFRFKGTVLGLVGLKGPDNGQFRVTVDDLPPETGTLFDSYSTPCSTTSATTRNHNSSQLHALLPVISETDLPRLAPAPFRHQRNESARY